MAKSAEKTVRAEKKAEKKKGIRKYLPFILILVLLFAFSSDILRVNEFFYGYSFFHDVGSSFAVHQSIVRNAEYPVWVPNLMSGEPNGNVGSMLSNPFLIFFNLVFDPVVAFKLTCLLHILMLLFGTFYLARHILKSDEAAMIVTAAVATTRMAVFSGHFTWFILGIAFIPWVFLFMIKAFEEKSYIKHTLIFSVLMVIQFVGGGVVHLYYSCYLYALYFIYQFLFCFRKQESRIVLDKDRLKRLSVIVLLALFVFLGLSAFRLFYFMDTIKYASNRVAGMRMSEILWGQINNFPDFLGKIVLSYKTNYANMNIFANALMVLGIIYGIRYRKRFPIFFAVSYLVFFLIATGFFVNILMHIPGFDKLRLIDRFTIINIFTGALLAGYGFLYLRDRLLKSFAFRKYLFVSVIAFIFLAGVFLNFDLITEHHRNQEPKETVFNSEYAKILSQDDDIFRIHVKEVTGTDKHNINLELFWFDLESIYGIFGTQWDNRYFHVFLGKAIYNASKSLGLLNVKYLLSADTNVPKGFEPYAEFNVSSSKISADRYPKFKTGYIYKNTDCLPRAFFVNKSILFVGDEQLAAKAGYIMLNEQRWNPKKAVVVQAGGMTLSQVPLDSLDIFDAIFLLEDSIVSEQDRRLMEDYVTNKGVIFPNRIAGETSYDTKKINDYLDSIEPDFTPVEITKYYYEDPNTIEISWDASLEGFIFVSEKMPLYEGWHAVSNTGPKRIFEANTIFSAVYVTKQDKYLKFDFYPKWYRIGNMVTLISVVILFVSLICWFFYGRKKRKNISC